MQNLRIRDPGPVRGGGRQAISAEWANRMRDCVMTLARALPLQRRIPAEWTPKRPFEATANGDNTINVNAGKLIWFSPDSLSGIPYSPFTGTTVSYAGEDVTVTTSGTLKLVADFTPTIVSDDSTYTLWTFTMEPDVGTNALAVEESPSTSGDQFTLPICTYTVTDGVAKVTEQIIDYNPIISLEFVQNYFS